MDELYLNSIEVISAVDIRSDTKSGRAWFKKVMLNGTEIEVKLDCGAEVSTLPEALFNKYFKSKVKLTPTDVILKCYGHFTVCPLGCALD